MAEWMNGPKNFFQQKQNQIFFIFSGFGRKKWKWKIARFVVLKSRIVCCCFTEKKVDGLVLTHLGWESKITFNNPNGLVLTRGFHNLFGLVLTLYDSWQFSLQRLFNRSIESTIDSLAQFFLLFILLQLIISSFSPSSN